MTRLLHDCVEVRAHAVQGAEQGAGIAAGDLSRFHEVFTDVDDCLDLACQDLDRLAMLPFCGIHGTAYLRPIRSRLSEPAPCTRSSTKPPVIARFFM